MESKKRNCLFQDVRYCIQWENPDPVISGKILQRQSQASRGILFLQKPVHALLFTRASRFNFNRDYMTRPCFALILLGLHPARLCLSSSGLPVLFIMRLKANDYAL